MTKATNQSLSPVRPIKVDFTPTSTHSENRATPGTWTRSVCPNCNYARADVDPEGILWCPACGYSKKGCYT